MTKYNQCEEPLQIQQNLEGRTKIFQFSRAFKRSNPLKSSPGSYTLSVSDSVGMTSSSSLLAFPLSVSFMSLCLCYFHFSVSISNS